jgi:hypothetical protein
MQRSSKVFGIGLNKTGTRSVADAMRVLGFRALHKGDEATSQLVIRAEREGRPLLDLIGTKYDAYFDVESIVHRFQALDEQYPGSKFVLTTRSLDGWMDSRQRHVEGNLQRAAAGRYSGSWLTVDRAGWQEEWDRHHEAVHTYFADRPGDLLVINVVDGDGWEKLAPFLGRALPAEPFPWENREGLGTYVALPVRERARRTALAARRGLRRLRR